MNELPKGYFESRRRIGKIKESVLNALEPDKTTYSEIFIALSELMRTFSRDMYKDELEESEE